MRDASGSYGPEDSLDDVGGVVILLLGPSEVVDETAESPVDVVSIIRSSLSQCSNSSLQAYGTFCLRLWQPFDMWDFALGNRWTSISEADTW